MKKLVLLLTLTLLCGSSVAQKKPPAPPQARNILKHIPYQQGQKNQDITLAEQAFSKHPMLAGAITGVIKSTRRCELFQYSLEMRPEDDRLSTQFNGGELKAEFTYFCFNQARAPHGRMDDEPEMADVVLSIRGDFSRARGQIMDPEISYSRCYGHYCGSN